MKTHERFHKSGKRGFCLPQTCLRQAKMRPTMKKISLNTPLKLEYFRNRKS
jgi:hypothetical protein